MVCLCSGVAQRIPILHLHLKMMLWGLVLLVPSMVVGFPDGAPVDACVKARPNTPYHGQLQSQPPQTSPYQIVASGTHFQPGTKITVTIQGEPFRGFFMQARDVATGQWVGHWDNAPNTKGIPECSAITHADNKDKLQATLVWSAPTNLGSGSVFFTGSVVKDYATFWTDLVGNTLQ